MKGSDPNMRTIIERCLSTTTNQVNVQSKDVIVQCHTEIIQGSNIDRHSIKIRDVNICQPLLFQ